MKMHFLKFFKGGASLTFMTGTYHPEFSVFDLLIMPSYDDDYKEALFLTRKELVNLYEIIGKYLSGGRLSDGK